MRLAVGLAWFAVIACDAATIQTGSVVWGSDLAPGFAALPRLTQDSPAARRINAWMEVRDALDREGRESCLADSPLNETIEWGRSVSAPMTGPRFLTVNMVTGYYCGGAHPSTEEVSVTYDLTTGAAPDWKALWPNALIETETSEARGPGAAVSRSPELLAWFRQAVRESPDSDAAWLRDCEAHYGDDPVDEGLVLWLDAEREGVAMDVGWLAHAEKACSAPQVMPVAEIERRGAAPELTAAVRAAHKTRSWRPFPAEAR